jgi:ATP adenylyltransferase
MQKSSRPACKMKRSKLNKDTSDVHCTFCNIPHDNCLLENDCAFAILDKYPVTPGHTLIIPKRHFADYFETTKVERDALYNLISMRREQLLIEDHKIAGFNIGINVGDAAGQTIPHCHVHLIPRRQGDYQAPKGGVRGVIPNKMKY